MVPKKLYGNIGHFGFATMGINRQPLRLAITTIPMPSHRPFYAALIKTAYGGTLVQTARNMRDDLAKASLLRRYALMPSSQLPTFQNTFGNYLRLKAK